MSRPFVVRCDRVVRPDGVAAHDVVVDGGTIVAVAPFGSIDDAPVVDAVGLALLPGVVDAHVHFDDPGRAWWEGFDRGSAAAAAGGVTTVVDMPIDSDPPTISVPALRAKTEAARARSRVDVALWAGLVPASLDVLSDLVAAGAVGFKAFACPSGWDDFPPVDDATLDAGCRIAAASGVPVAVHCEHPELGTGPDSEIAAVRWAASIAARHGARLHVVHASAAGAVTEARRWANTTVETCPHYLTLTSGDVEQIGPTAICRPPIRDAGNRAALWDHVRAGTVDWIASDHSPAPPEQRAGPAPWAGIAGVQLTLPVLLDARLDLTVIAHLITAAAPSLRLARKGAIAVGHDADLALVDTETSWTVTESRLYDRHRASPLIGRTLRGAVVTTWVRGVPVFEQGRGVRDGAGGTIVTPAPA